ncbi:MAG TPA: O-methyltransferase [Pseudomonadota bacterium]|jgi:caffeoyl-CoA O-methyltransferase|nr:O-methyltransferase [Pseudomonadota bacterium]HND09864.1 O-methyltransferase [Pseudomonadota bacterium]HNK43253.1 O-methyltransferase [Pseudomonadota bacterium]HNN50024.1 O-methyltransferase [Pseudomonadota bacterium]HNO69343.1 O-methyltransferase [Pseudomonadota bacterium]
MTPALEEYLTSHSTRRDDVLSALAQETAQLGDVSVMQIAELQGSLLSLLVRATSAVRAIEVGTFTGYSAICVARALPPHGKLLCCDVSDEWTQIARRYFAQAKVEDKIDLQIGPALETLRRLPQEPLFDIGFIDADKVNQQNYYEEVLTRLRSGGLLLIDNVLRDGRVTDPTQSDPSLDSVRACNDAVARDPRVEVVMLPIADGLSLIRKR